MENDKQNSQDLASLEIERKKTFKDTTICNLIGIALIVFGIILMVVVHFACIILAVIGIILVLVGLGKQKKFSKNFKDVLIKNLIKEELGEEATYNPKGGIPIEEINSLNVALRPDKYYMEDLICSKYNGIPYEMCDCVMQERVVHHDSHGRTTTTYETYFKGRIIKVDFKRDLKMQLKVVNAAPKGFKPGSLVKFETEVIDFNKRFKCYASTQEDAFYIMTPSLIQKMMELERKFKGGICYIIMHDNLYILINNGGDSLEVKISKQLNEKELNRTRSEIILAASIINEFRMDSDKYNVNR